MKVDWGDYEPADSGVVLPLREVPRADARRVFKQCMESRPSRREMLSRLVGRSGVELRSDDKSVQQLNDWFLTHVEPDPDYPGSLLPVWYAVCHDVALFLGDLMIQRHPQLRWEFVTWRKSDVAYHRHVIMGFTTEDPKYRTYFDIHDNVETYGHGVVARQGSVHKYGTVVVRGASIDVDAIEADHRAKPIATDEFLQYLQIAARRA